MFHGDISTTSRPTIWANGGMYSMADISMFVGFTIIRDHHSAFFEEYLYMY